MRLNYTINKNWINLVEGETIECYKGVKKANGEGKIETTECPDGVTQCIKGGNNHGTDLYSLSGKKIRVIELNA